MRKTLMGLMMTVLIFSANAQTKKQHEYKKRPSLGLSVMFNDFVTPQRMKNSSFGEVIKNKEWATMSDMTFGGSLQFLQGLNNHLDFTSRLDFSLEKYPYGNDPAHKNNESFLLEWGADIRAKLLSDRYIVTPYVSLGIGAAMYKSRFGAFMPMGGGIQVNLGKGDAFLFLDMQYRSEVSNWTKQHLNYSLGFANALTEKKTKAVVVAPPAPVAELDSDGDGIPDSKDKCPHEKGLARYDGCPIPDTDGDGINDEEDKCPTVPGLAKYQGCPIPDTDGDGINDEEDKCPTVAGLARYHGCPIPDTDGDGINDEEDECPNEPGPASNKGCPTKAQVHQASVDTAATNVFFATGSAVLLKKSYTSLNQVVKLLKENSDLMIEVSGHTDNTGTDKINNRLSQSRADAVAKYLKSKGVQSSQIQSKGYGSTQPIASNETAEGRAKNRRVEMKLKDK